MFSDNYLYDGQSFLERIFGDRIFFRNLWVLALPIIIQNFLASSLNLIDTVMIGFVGENEVAAVGVANQFFFLFNMFIYGIASGSSVFISQYWGSGNRKNILKIMGVGVTSLLVTGLFFTALARLVPGGIILLFSDSGIVRRLGADYLRIVCISYIPTALSFLFSHGLRSVNKAYIPMLISAAAILTNTGLNYLLIFGKLGLPALGVSGAALATLIARCLECCLLMLVSFRKGSVFRAGLKEYLSFDLSFVKNAYATIFPVILNEGLWGLGAVFYTAAYGRIGTAALAATNITNTIQNLFMVLCLSIASAALVMIGNQIGSRNLKRVRTYARNFTALTALLGLVLGALIVGMAPFILSFYQISAEAKSAALRILWIFGGTYVIRQVNLVMVIGIFRGGGDVRVCLAIDLLSMWLIGVPIAFIGAVFWKLPVEYVVALISIEEIVKFAACVIRYRSGKWIHDIT